jgi:GTP pyrophosphokinase
MKIAGEQSDAMQPAAFLKTARELREEIGRLADVERAVGAARRSVELEAILDDLKPDAEIRAAALLYPLAAAGVLSRETVARRCGEPASRLIGEMVKLGSFGLPKHWHPDKPLPHAQAETLRKMLLAIVADVRLVTVRLADQLRRLRAVKQADDEIRQRIATETRVIFAPLANRLGIWHLKWELEDLAFRYLEPETYHEIAAALREQRSVRESRIREVIDDLDRELAAAGIRATIQGRPKHIYSIWRKMQRKSVGLDEIFDISAVRVLVNTIADCYAVLGLVHGRWAYIPGEFDDYIANPKGNFYRSLHTAVSGPGEQPLEIQIRTWEMDAHAELGVAAHWRYKEGGGADPAFEKKITWLRHLLEPGEDNETDSDFIDRLRAEIFEDRVYAVTPDGDIVDLPAGATPLDFAYHVHTEVGHHCRGAKVNGRMVTLTHRLTNGDKVEIITAESVRPSRDWLIPQRGYLASPRSRAKVRSWFRRQDQEVNRKHGRAMLEKELQRLGVQPDLERLAAELKLGNAEQLYLAIGAGDVTLASVAKTVERLAPVDTEVDLLRERRPAARRRPSRGGIVVSWVGELMTHLARCCRPVPPEPIAGYVTLGRGVSIHRQACRNLLRLREQHPERLLEVAWDLQTESGFSVDVTVEAYDRRGLLRDISTVLTDERVDIMASNTRTDRRSNTATIDLTLVIRGLEQLSRILHRIGSLPNVYSVRRRG